MKPISFGGKNQKSQKSPSLALVMVYMTLLHKNDNISRFSSYLGELEAMIMIFKSVSIFSSEDR